MKFITGLVISDEFSIYCYYIKYVGEIFDRAGKVIVNESLNRPKV